MFSMYWAEGRAVILQVSTEEPQQERETLNFQQPFQVAIMEKKKQNKTKHHNNIGLWTLLRLFYKVRE